MAEATLPSKPEEVLPYLEQVYKDGDIDAYANLLASDYHFVLEDMGVTWDAAGEVKGTRKLFQRASAELTFSGDTSVKRASQPGMWFIDNVTGDLQVTQKKDGKVFRVQNTYAFVIRNENGTLRIVQWRQKLSK
jgi:ketosteroid isomerase-like protein